MPEGVMTMSADSVRAKVNPAVLRWARQSMNYPIDEISRSTGVPADVVERWECGDKMPTLRQLGLLAINGLDLASSGNARTHAASRSRQ